MGHREQVLRFLTAYPGRDDDEIAAALKIKPRQTVNMVCRKLRDEGRLRRVPNKQGKLINFIRPVGSIPDEAPVRPQTQFAREVRMTEDELKLVLSQKLEREGWKVAVAWGRTRGIDVVATRANDRWLIECKGVGKTAPMQNNYFLGVIGEVLQRMHDETAKHSIALPDISKYRRLWTELPQSVKQKLGLTVLFVANDGTVSEERA